MTDLTAQSEALLAEISPWWPGQPLQPSYLSSRLAAIERAAAERACDGLREAGMKAARDFHMAAFRGQWPGEHTSSVIEECRNEMCREHVAALAAAAPGEEG